MRSTSKTPQRLSAMLDAAAIAFLVLTAEDERADGKMQARMGCTKQDYFKGGWDSPEQ